MSSTVPPTEPVPTTTPAAAAPLGERRPPAAAPAGAPVGAPVGGAAGGRRRGPLVAALVVAVLLLLGSVGATVAWASGGLLGQHGVVRYQERVPGMHLYGPYRDQERPYQGVQPRQRGGMGGGCGRVVPAPRASATPSS